jgi:hypothetical protein
VSVLTWGRETHTLLGRLERSNVNHWTTHVEVEVKLRPAVIRPVCVGVALPSGTSDNRRILDFEHPLWREDGSLIYLYNCLWALPEQLLSGSSPADLTTLFYCFIWDSPNLEGQVSVFYLSRYKMAFNSNSESHVTTDGQSVSLDVEPLFGSLDQTSVTVWRLLSCLCGASFLTRALVCELLFITSR